MNIGDQPKGAGGLCDCLQVPQRHLELRQDLGLDNRFAEVSLLVCRHCGQYWLKYFYEVEAFRASARWYLGAIGRERLPELTADNAKETLENLDWYFYGGSYFEGRTGKTSGEIVLDP
jgi:hypothetical protein